MLLIIKQNLLQFYLTEYIKLLYMSPLRSVLSTLLGSDSPGSPVEVFHII